MRTSNDLTRVTLPASVKELEGRLTGLDRLARATGWERAAIVYAFTEPGEGGPRTGRKSGQLSIREFAERGFAGLSHRDTVAAYRSNWEHAIEQGRAVPVKPGDTIDLPIGLDWPPTKGETTNGATGVAKSARSVANVLGQVKPNVLVEALTIVSDEGFTAIVEAVDAVSTPAAPEVNPDLPEPPAAKPTKKQIIVDDWAANKAKRDLAERQARLDAELEAARLAALAQGGKVPDQPEPVQDQFGGDFGAWTALEQRVTELLTELQLKRDQYGISDYEQTRVQEWAVHLLDVAAGRSRVTGLGQVVQA